MTLNIPGSRKEGGEEEVAFLPFGGNGVGVAHIGASCMSMTRT